MFIQALNPFPYLFVASNMQTLLPTNIDTRASRAFFLCHWGWGRESGLIRASSFVAAPPKIWGWEKNWLRPRRLTTYAPCSAIAASQNPVSEGGDGECDACWNWKDNRWHFAFSLYTSGKKDLGPDQFVLRRPSTVHVLNELSGNIGCQPPTA